MLGCAGELPCLAGSTRSCVGPAACPGSQACEAAGSWAACECGEPLEVDPCRVNNGGCDPVAACSAVAGGVRCTCPDSLEEHGRNCGGPRPEPLDPERSR